MILLKDWQDLGIECMSLTAYQYRLMKGSYVIDYYPTTGKYFDFQQKLWGQTEPSEVVNLFPDAIPCKTYHNGNNN